MNVSHPNTLERLRYRNSAGRLIREHRALLRIRLERLHWMQPAFLPTAIFVLVLLLLKPIGRFWYSIIEFWAQKLELPGQLRTESRWIGNLHIYDLPYLDVPSTTPDSVQLVTCLVLVLSIMLLSYLLLRRSLPIAYIVWAYCLIQITSITFFYFRPATFPYTIGSHLRGGLEMNVALLLTIPWLLGPTYYAFEFALWKKLAATLLMIVHLVLFSPLQYMAHAKLIHDMTLVVMPLLYIMFGLFANIFCFIAIYGWAMSWERVQRM
ncbi:MAG: hypothetical protein U1F34_08835 [Gammaproteobacteria bacterium]